jgi:hypothetical protein
METEGQWCDNAFCPDRGKIDTDNIKMHSYAERRLGVTLILTIDALSMLA